LVEELFFADAENVVARPSLLKQAVFC